MVLNLANQLVVQPMDRDIRDDEKRKKQSGYCNIIGDLNLGISWAQGIAPGKPGLQYEQFGSWKQGLSDCDISIEVLDGCLTPQGKLVFSTENSWDLYQLENGYLLNWGEANLRWNVTVSEDYRHAILRHGNYRNATEISGAIQFTERLVDFFLIRHVLADREGIVLHSAGGDIHTHGIVFPAFSGGGKSTLSRFLAQDTENQIFSDDRIIIRRFADEWQLYGTPWAGDEGIAIASKRPLDAMVFLTQADSNKIRPLNATAAYSRLIQVCSIPWYDKRRTKLLLDLCENLLQTVPMYELCFTKNIEMVKTIKQFSTEVLT